MIKQKKFALQTFDNKGFFSKEKTKLHFWVIILAKKGANLRF